MIKIKIFLWWIVLSLSLFVIFYNTVQFLHYGISMKYEVEHPRMMKGDDKGIQTREAEINNLLHYFQLIYVYSILALVSSINGIKMSRQKEASLK